LQIHGKADPICVSVCCTPVVHRWARQRRRRGPLLFCFVSLFFWQDRVIFSARYSIVSLLLALYRRSSDNIRGMSPFHY
jgi:hypothetical protein